MIGGENRTDDGEEAWPWPWKASTCRWGLSASEDAGGRRNANVFAGLWDLQRLQRVKAGSWTRRVSV